MHKIFSRGPRGPAAVVSKGGAASRRGGKLAQKATSRLSPSVRLKPQKPSWVARARLFLAGAAAGAGALFVAGPNGRRRRNIARDGVMALFRTLSRVVRRKARRVEGAAAGAVHETAQRTRSTDGNEPGDATLAAKVESEIFRDKDVPKGDINVNAENGVIYLRGQVDSPDLIERLVAAARDVDGVKDVESLLHLPGTPAPTKAEGRAD